MTGFTITTVTAVCQRHPQTGKFVAKTRPHSLNYKAAAGFLMLDCPTCGRGYVYDPGTGEWMSDRKLTVISEVKEIK